MSMEELRVEAGDREYRVRGLNPYASARMKVTVRVVRGEKFHIDSLDLYLAKARQGFTERSAKALGVSEEEIAGDLLKVIETCEAERKEAVSALHASFSRTIPKMTREEERLGMGLLTDPGLMSRVAEDMEALGYIGEGANKGLAYLVAVSRKLPEPLSAIVLSRSAAGKSALLRLIERLTPPEEMLALSSFTPQALYYLPTSSLKNRLLLIEERHGSAPADYSIRELQTRRVLRKGVPAKDPASGMMRTNLVEVEGPVAVIESTTDPEIDPENENRCLILHVDESREQTGRVLASQRREATLVGMKRTARTEEIVRAHFAAQRLLRPLPVVIPYAERMVFPSGRLRYRRDQAKFLGLVRAVASLHQYQRPQKETEVEGERMRYIEASVEDYRAARDLMGAVLSAASGDLSAIGRRLLEDIRVVASESRGAEAKDFTRRQMREATSWSHDQLKRHLGELVEKEYLAEVRGERGERHRYRLLDGEALGMELPQAESLAARAGAV